MKLATTYLAILGVLVEQGRRAKGWSQVELADATGLSQALLSRVERGRAQLNIEQFAVLAGALDTLPGLPIGRAHLAALIDGR